MLSISRDRSPSERAWNIRLGQRGGQRESALRWNERRGVTGVSQLSLSRLSKSKTRAPRGVARVMLHVVYKDLILPKKEDHRTYRTTSLSTKPAAAYIPTPHFSKNHLSLVPCALSFLPLFRSNELVLPFVNERSPRVVPMSSPPSRPFRCAVAPKPAAGWHVAQRMSTRRDTAAASGADPVEEPLERHR